MVVLLEYSKSIEKADGCEIGERGASGGDARPKTILPSQSWALYQSESWEKMYVSSGGCCWGPEAWASSPVAAESTRSFTIFRSAVGLRSLRGCVIVYDQLKNAKLHLSVCIFILRSFHRPERPWRKTRTPAEFPWSHELERVDLQGQHANALAPPNDGVSSCVAYRSHNTLGVDPPVQVIEQIIPALRVHLRPCIEIGLP